MQETIKKEADDFEKFAKTDLDPHQRRYLEMCVAACWLAGQHEALKDDTDEKGA